ncbi:MAG: beta-lactamase family protein [Planctomycetaceae bacterium]|jgi:CubicO group peptidase (beta-lactamase class C family)|nr:beta-lactamase family protein [Planctomycetaceae bacterium]
MKKNRKFDNRLSVLLFLVLGLTGLAQENEIANVLQPYVDSGEMPGFVTLLATKDKILQINTIGYADVAAQTPMNNDTIFWIASSSKPLAAAAVMILVDEGKIDLDESIATYLPEFRDLKLAVPNDDGTILLKKLAKLPTIRQCLSHTGGWRFLSPYMQRFGIDSLPPVRAAETYAMLALNYEPGTQYLYSNIGINITSAVVEKVSGLPFGEFMKQRIFEPLGMKETTYVPTSEQVKRIAKSYRYDNEKKSLQETKIHFLTYPLDDPHHRYAEAGGGIFSTAPEIVRFFQMLANDGKFQGKQILTVKSVEEMRTKQTGTYGLGLGLFGDFYGHGGAYGNDAVIHKPTGHIAIYMVQVTGVPKQNEAKQQYQKALQTFLK